MMPVIRNLGLCDYQKTWLKMRDFTLSRTNESADEIWFLQHFAVFTQGQAGKPEHILNIGDIPLIKTDRGGQVTYHGEGQLLAYCLIDLRRKKIGVKQLVNILENSVINLLDEYNIKANSRTDAPGVYINNAKICSIGLKITRGCSYHGIALNVNMDLTPFSRINPCGFKNLTMTQMRNYLANVTVDEVAPKLSRHLLNNLLVRAED